MLKKVLKQARNILTNLSPARPEKTGLAYNQPRSRGAIAPTIPKVALTIFKLIKFLMCKSKKCVSANQRNCLNICYNSTFIRT